MPHIEGHAYGDIPDLEFEDLTAGPYEPGTAQWYASLGSDPANLEQIVEYASGTDVDAEWLAEYGGWLPIYDPTGEAFAEAEYVGAGEAYGLAGETYSTAGDIYGIAGGVYGLAGETYQQALGAYGLAGETYEQAQDVYGMAGREYSRGLGSIFEQAGADSTNLMEAWTGAGQRMGGRKLRQKKALKKKAGVSAQKIKTGYKQAGIARKASETAYGAAGLRYESAGTAYGIAGSKYDLAGETYEQAGVSYDAAGLSYALADIDRAEDIYDRREDYAEELRQALIDLADMDAFLGLDVWERPAGTGTGAGDPTDPTDPLSTGDVTVGDEWGGYSSGELPDTTGYITGPPVTYGDVGFGLGEGGDESQDSCLVAGSPVLMSDGEYKNIEDIVKGDKIIGWGDRIHTVVELRPMKLGSRKLYGINSDAMFFTEEHPLMTADGWKALNPEKTKRENPVMELERLQVGDVVMQGEYSKDLGFVYKPVQIESLEYREDDPDTDVFNLHLSDGISFHVYDIPFHTIQSGIVVDRYAEEGLDNLCEEDKQKFVTAFSTIPGLMDATAKAFGSTFINIFTKLGHQNG